MLNSSLPLVADSSTYCPRDLPISMARPLKPSAAIGTRQISWAFSNRIEEVKMSKRRRTTAQRNTAKRKWKLAQALNGGDQSTGATDATDSPTSPQATGESDIQHSETAFKPEILTQSPANGHGAAGLGETVELARNRWDEIRAVKERYPVSRGMLERMAFEAINVATSETASVRDRLIGIKLLLTMAEGNRPDKGLPAQIEIGVENTEEARLRIRRIIDAMPLEIVDEREFKVVPGSTDDYAE